MEINNYIFMVNNIFFGYECKMLRDLMFIVKASSCLADPILLTKFILHTNPVVRYGSNNASLSPWPPEKKDSDTAPLLHYTYNPLKQKI